MSVLLGPSVIDTGIWAAEASTILSKRKNKVEPSLDVLDTYLEEACFTIRKKRVFWEQELK